MSEPSQTWVHCQENYQFTMVSYKGNNALYEIEKEFLNGYDELIIRFRHLKIMI